MSTTLTEAEKAKLAKCDELIDHIKRFTPNHSRRIAMYGSPEQVAKILGQRITRNSAGEFCYRDCVVYAVPEPVKPLREKKKIALSSSRRDRFLGGLDL